MEDASYLSTASSGEPEGRQGDGHSQPARRLGNDGVVEVVRHRATRDADSRLVAYLQTRKVRVEENACRWDHGNEATIVETSSDRLVLDGSVELEDPKVEQSAVVALTEFNLIKEPIALKIADLDEHASALVKVINGEGDVVGSSLGRRLREEVEVQVVI